jgi:hypothetical protein
MRSYSKNGLKIRDYYLWPILRYKRSEDARMALEQMEGFELAGRTVSITAFH